MRSTNPEKNPMRNLDRGAWSNPKCQHHPIPSPSIAPKDYLSGLRSGDLEAHRAGCSPSRFDRCPYQSSLGMAGSASAQADDGNRWMDSVEETGRVGIVAEDTAEDFVAEDIAAGTDIATLDIAAAAKVTECTAAARMDKTLCRKEDTGSDNNPDHSRACASIPVLGLVRVSCSCLMLTDPVASARQSPCHWALVVGMENRAPILRVSASP